MNRLQLISRLNNAWQDFGESYAGLTEALLTEPGVTGDWSLKDILTHVSTWENESLAYLPLIMRGGRPPRYGKYGGIDAFNARTIAAKRQLSLAEVQTELEDTHRRLVAFLQTAPEEQFSTETRFRRRLRWDTYGHYREHEKMIRAWRESRGV